MASNSSTTGGLYPPSMLLLENSAHSQSSNIIAAWVVMIVLAAFTVSLRFYTRRFILTVLALEDWLILVAMVLYLGHLHRPTMNCLLTSVCLAGPLHWRLHRLCPSLVPSHNPSPGLLGLTTVRRNTSGPWKARVDGDTRRHDQVADGILHSK